jgi:hypothetical protein
VCSGEILRNSFARYTGVNPSEEHRPDDKNLEVPAAVKKAEMDAARIRLSLPDLGSPSGESRSNAF